MKIGIFGGSFNPIHRGHEAALKAFMRHTGAERVFVIPSFYPPHKDMPTLWASFEDRLAMTELAVGCVAGVTVTDIERKLFEQSGEKSYTKITLQHLKNKYVGEYYLYVGTDMFTTLHLWREAKYLFDNAVIAVMSRDGDSGIIEEYKKRYEKEFGADITVIEDVHLEMCSTDIRQKISRDDESELISPLVLEYIQKNGLYRPRMSYEELKAAVKSRLPEKRFLHTLAVERETRYLASMLCPDFEEELARAALLHDVTKYLPEKEQLDMAGDLLTDDDLKSPETLHALTGGIYARRLGEEMWKAVESHTTGREDMSLFEMIIFTADYVEETRTHTACIEERRLLHSRLENCEGFGRRKGELTDSVIRILGNTVSYLREKRVFIHPRTLDALDHYRTLKAEEKNEK